jgi:hypothetical protein
MHKDKRLKKFCLAYWIRLDDDNPKKLFPTCKHEHHDKFMLFELITLLNLFYKLSIGQLRLLYLNKI